MGTKAKAMISVDDPYLELVLNVHPLRPIRSVEEHQAAKKSLRSLAGDRREVAAEFKKVLISIIEVYERESGLQLDTSGVSAAKIVRHLLAERQMSINTFAKARGISQSALSDMLNGKREWSKSVIVAVADFFGLNRGLFLQ
ncbi:MAG TPA: helix-turn-helix domain-containing protein [Tepidisphaeraceae bacterium]|jgi:antitoxin component HigA of HigAB toxin-antitoxin module